MTQPRYQIFVSSTFKDLKDEREAILNAILKLNQFPAGMELFPATNDTAWKHIEKIIKDSDYYVLVIGGKYGSMDETGISYTEKEYDFATSQNIPVLAFVRSDEENIPAGKIELDIDVREKLKKFKQKVGDEHHLNYWKNIEELKANVLSSLSMAFVMNPQTGWVKSGGIDNTELLTRLADLQQRYDNLLEENKNLQNTANENYENFAQGEDLIHFELKGRKTKNSINVKITWNDIFFSLAEYLTTKLFAGDVREKLHTIIHKHFLNNTENYLLGKNEKEKEAEISKYRFSEEDFQMIKNQLLTLNLIQIHEITNENSSPFGHGRINFVWYWQLTDRGIQLYLNRIALRRQQ